MPRHQSDIHETNIWVWNVKSENSIVRFLSRLVSETVLHRQATAAR
jgi:hypothetical protein